MPASVGNWAKRNVVVVVAVVLALASAVIVPPDADYLGYFDARTLVTLFSMLAVVAALQRTGFFRALAGRIVARFKSLRGLVIMLVLVTAAASALFTNDMALIALLPLAYLALASSEALRHLPLTFVLMTVAANLGGMITPFGSPQNLYLYSFYGIALGEFVQIMAVPFVVSLALLLALSFLVPNTPVLRSPQPAPLAERRTTVFLVLFVVTVLVVLRMLPLAAAAFVPLVLLVVDRRALVRMDWALLGTFAAFFVFAGNMARMPVVAQAITSLLDGGVLLWSALTSQVISNVPTAILLSQFTGDYAALLIGVNIGGVGTLVASLASLIALAEVRRAAPTQTRSFLVAFTWVNALFFVALLALMLALV